MSVDDKIVGGWSDVWKKHGKDKETMMRRLTFAILRKVILRSYHAMMEMASCSVVYEMQDKGKR